jgi:nucleoporin POM152
MVQVAPEDFLSRAKNGSWIRAPICVSKEDHLDLELVGSPPFQVAYTIGKDKERPEPHSFNSIQTKYRLPLQTSRSGHVFYQVTSVGDARYPLTERRTTNEPIWEQQVLARPTAYFKTSERLSYCLNDALVPRSDSQDGLVILEGKAPFLVHFTIQNLASSEVTKEVVEFNRHEWNLEFPNYKFSTVGSYLITIDSVRDASSCEEIVYDEGRRSIWVDVAETAMVVPYERRADVCVGDLLQFQLEGIAPWTITYVISLSVI